MTVTLTIENFAALPDGGPLSITLSGRRGIDIGRDQYLDWTLPDPDRAISGKHAEIRYREDGYWLQDVSRNGTFLNRNPQRLQEAYRLRDGDRIQIGQYLIVARIAGEMPAAQPVPPAQVQPEDYWEPQGHAPPPIQRRGLAAPAAPVNADFINWAVDLPVDVVPPQAPSADDGMDWAQASPAPLPPAPPPKPAPRRPAKAPEPETAPSEGAWGSPQIRGADPHPERMPAVPPAPRGEPVAPRADAGGGDAFAARFAAGLGIPPETLAWKDAGDLAEEAGVLLRLCTENLKQLLAARAESKRSVKATSHTTIQALENNPLKFAPTTTDALRIMLGRPSGAYLEAGRAFETGFRDLKTHQVKTYSAMQNALRLLTDDLSPEGIEASDEKDRGLSGLLGSRKARLWDIYTTRWDALASSHDDGMVDVFMILFADCYDKNR